ncbi:hypothetical protein I315_05321 [Cryptococcus gattii Ru294]|nr:hypothetical protein I315_05321 [Cryptococcus gattii Ru294]
MRALGEHLPRTLGEVAEHGNKIDWLTSSLISSFAINKSYQQSYLIVLQRRLVRTLLDPIMAPNGYYQDAEMNSTVGRPNWDHLKCHFYQNLVNAAVDICLPDSSVSSMPSREELCKRVKDYLEGTAKMKKRMKAEREANQLLKAICARVNPLSAWIKTNFERILKSLLLVYRMEASVHGLSTSHNLLDSQDDEGLTSDANQYAEFLVLCDLYEQERVDEPSYILALKG